MATLRSIGALLHSSTSTPCQDTRQLHSTRPWISRQLTGVGRPAEREKAAQESSCRDERVDSAIDLPSPEERRASESEKTSKARFHTLPNNIRLIIFQYTVIETQPIEPKQLSQRTRLRKQIHLPPLAHAVPSLVDEIILHLPDYLHNNSFSFDLRTNTGTTIFATWLRALGPLAVHIQSLRLQHWTAWWGFGHSSWTVAVDTTHITRDKAGNLEATRAITTPANETCDCGVLQLLQQGNAWFDPAVYRGIRSMPEFIACLRHPYQNRWPLPLIEVGRSFAAMLNQTSRELRMQYGMAGSLCRKCEMPKLYVCGHLSTSESGVTEEEMKFNSLACPVKA